MPRSNDWQAPDDVLPPPNPPLPVPLAPIDCDSDWRECLDAGHENGPTTMHRERGWRSVGWWKP